jgi:ArsR family transcriptional regulator
MQVRENDHAPLSADLGPLFRMHAELCRALGNQYRLAILCALREGEMCVGDLADDLGIAVHNASRHLRVLKENRIVHCRKEGKAAFYSITNPKFTEACTLIRQAIVEQYQAEGAFLQAAELLDRSLSGPGEWRRPNAP